MSSSDRRAAAARANGAKSHGPVTPEGKARSSANARKYDFTAGPVTLRNENPAALQELGDEYYAEWQPATPSERDLVDQMVLCRFRLWRIWAAEAATLDLQMDRDADAVAKEFQQLDEPVRCAVAIQNLADGSKVLDHLSRYESRYHRQYMRALKELKQLQRERAENRDLPPAPAAANLQNEPTDPAPCNLQNEPSLAAAAPPKLQNEPGLVLSEKVKSEQTNPSSTSQAVPPPRNGRLDGIAPAHPLLRTEI